MPIFMVLKKMKVVNYSKVQYISIIFLTLNIGMTFNSYQIQRYLNFYETVCVI